MQQIVFSNKNQIYWAGWFHVEFMLSQWIWDIYVILSISRVYVFVIQFFPISFTAFYITYCVILLLCTWYWTIVTSEHLITEDG